MTEVITSPERQAQMAVDEYMFTDPSIAPGTFGIEQLEAWENACKGVPLSPEQQFVAGWIDVELAFAHRQLASGEDDTDRLVAVADSLAAASGKFAEVADHPSLQVDPLMRAHARIALGGANVLKACLGEEDFDPHFRRYLSLQAKAAQATLEHLEKTGSARAAMLADSLTLLMLVAGNHQGYIPLPASPRNMSPDVDGFYRWNALLLTTEGELLRARVADEGPPDMVNIPPQVFDQKRFTASSGYGTLQAVIWLQNTIDTHQFRPTPHQLKTFDKLYNHHSAVVESTFQVIGEQRAALNAPEEPLLHTSPYEWYGGLNPQRHPFVVDQERLDAAMSPLELEFTEGTLDSVRAAELAWMHVEYAMGRALDPRATALQVGGDLDRAEDIFSYALDKLQHERHTVPYYETWLAQAAIPVYRAIACRDPEAPVRLEEYKQALTAAAQTILQRGTVSEELDGFVQRLTTCLLISVQGEEDYAALPSAPRQRQEGGWDIHVWSQTLEGFVPHRFGRLRMATRKNPLSLSDGIVTITPEMLGQKDKTKRTRTLQALVDYHTAPTSQHKKAIDKAWHHLAPAIAAAEV